MKRRMISAVMALAMMATVSAPLSVSAAETVAETAEPVVTSAETGTYGELEYEVNEDGTITITYCDSDAVSVEIPETIDGRTVTSIGDYSFEDCALLASINIPDSITDIGYYAFYNCDSLTSISLPNNVMNIGYLAFSDCSSLTEIEVSDNNEFYSSDEGVLFNKDKTELIQCPGGRGGDYVIPDGVINICIGAFSGCSLLTTINNIPDEITEIYDYTFRGCSSLTNITLPNNITSIGDYAFTGCSMLTSIRLPDGLTSIYRQAFRDCDRLVNISLPDSVSIVDYLAFHDCNNLTKIEVSDNNEFYSSDEGVLFNKDKTELIQYPGGKGGNYVIPSGVTNIEDCAFANCSNLTNISMPDSVIDIGDEAFGSCLGLTNIIIGNNVASIGFSAFGDCSNLENVYIPDSVTYIGSHAFIHCDALINVSIPDSVTHIGQSAFEYCSNLTSISIGSGVTSIGSYAFENCSSLSDIYYDGSLSDFRNIYRSFGFLDVTLHCSDKTYIDWGTCGDDLTWTIDNTGTLTISGTGAMEDYAGYPDSARSPFYDNESITSVVIEDGVTAIGEIAFEDCSALSSVTIPKSVTSIGNSAFSGCYELENVYYTSDISQWCNIVFCNSLSNPMYYEGTLYVNNDLVTEINIPDGVTSIGNYAFYGCTDLKSITIPDSVTSIGDYAFSGCSGLISFTIPDTITSINDGLFNNCSALNSVTIPDSVKTIGDYAFYNCSSLTSISLPDGVTSIGKYAFFSCVGLTALVLPPSVTEIGSNAYGEFEYNDFFGDGKGFYEYPVTLYGYSDSAAETYAYESNNNDYEYSRTKITFVAYGSNDSGSSIQYCTPYENGNSCLTILNNIEGKPLTEIAENAFSTCNELTDVYFEGTKEEWNALTIQSGNDFLLNAEIHFNSVQPSPIYTNDDITAIMVTQMDEGYRFNVKIENAPVDSAVIAVVYSDGEMVAQRSASLDPYFESVGIDVNGKGDTAKIFVWDDFQSMTPLCQAASIDL